MENKNKVNNVDRSLWKDMDWFSILVPLSVVILLCIAFFVNPAGSTVVLQAMRHFVGDSCSVYFAAIGLGIFLFTMYIGLSRYGKIRFGKTESRGSAPAHTPMLWKFPSLAEYPLRSAPKATRRSFSAVLYGSCCFSPYDSCVAVLPKSCYPAPFLRRIPTLARSPAITATFLLPVISILDGHSVR